MEWLVLRKRMNLYCFCHQVSILTVVTERGWAARLRVALLRVASLWAALSRGTAAIFMFKTGCTYFWRKLILKEQTKVLCNRNKRTPNHHNCQWRQYAFIWRVSNYLLPHCIMAWGNMTGDKYSKWASLSLYYLKSTDRYVGQLLTPASLGY